jgi:hypothetical protein
VAFQLTLKQSTVDAMQEALKNSVPKDTETRQVADLIINLRLCEKRIQQVDKTSWVNSKSAMLTSMSICTAAGG